MKSEPSARERTFRLWSEIDAMRNRLRQLHQQAGIASAVENLSLPSGFPADLDLPVGSEEARQASEAEQEYQGARFRRGLRQLYFDVPDLELRRDLIQTSRLVEDTNMAQVCAAADMERDDLAKVRKPSSWFVMASMVGIVAVYFGYQLAGVSGAIGGALVGFFFNRHLEASAKARQRAAVTLAEERSKAAQETAQKVADRGHIFSQSEATSGAPDDGAHVAKVVSVSKQAKD